MARPSSTAKHWLPVLALFAAAAASFSHCALAHPLSRQECTEGSDFIRNAALSRNNGMEGTRFISSTLADFEAIKSFPPQLRWFVQDDQDEAYLLRAVTDVFENPREPDTHQQAFLAQCLERAALTLPGRRAPD
ncbi:MAG TPA: hypothetical protein VN667_16640 [Burkholderiales bacterium]|nr:hypothetical protein [Burkholderiales bacterium]